MRRLLLSVCILAGLSQVALAGAAEDAAFIAERTVSSADYRGGQAELNRQIFRNIEAGLQRLGAEVVDPDRFIEELVGSWPTVFEAEFAQVLNAALTEKELAELAEFYRSDEGRDYLETGELLNPVAMLDVLRRAMAVRSGLEAALAPRLNEMFSPQRVAEILEMPDVVRFENEATRDDVVHALRNAQLPGAD